MNRLNFLVLAGAAFAVPALSGCQPRKNASADSGPVSVRIAYFPNITHAAALYASSTGKYTEAVQGKATVEERVFTAGPAEMEALFAGEVDFGYIGPGPAINGFEKSRGEALQIVAGAASGGAGLVVRKDSGIKSIADLKGKKLAVPQTGGSQDISARFAIENAGLKTKDRGGDVEVVQYAPADTLTQMQRGEIDAAWLPEPWISRLEKEIGATLVVDERTLWPGERFSTAVVIVRRKFADEHPEIVAALLKAHQSAVDEMKKDPDASLAVIGKKIAELNAGKAIPEQILKQAMSRTEITSDLLEESILTFADHAKALGYLKEGRTAFSGLFRK